MSELISRQAAISAICNACGKIDCDKMDKCEKLQLPPANCSEFPNNSDTISRQAAIGIVEFECGEWSGLAKTIAEEIKQMPSAQPERKNGAWINEGRIIRCNRCKIGYATVKGMKSALTYKFCPNCGCRMKGADDE